MREILKEPLRNFIRILVQDPQKIKKEDFEISYSIFPHEFCHIFILIRGKSILFKFLIFLLEARFGTSMVYFLQALKAVCKF